MAVRVFGSAAWSGHGEGLVFLATWALGQGPGAMRRGDHLKRQITFVSNISEWHFAEHHARIILLKPHGGNYY